MLLQAVLVPLMRPPNPPPINLLHSLKGLKLLLFSLHEPLMLMAAVTPLPMQLIKALKQGCSGTGVHCINALLSGVLSLHEGGPLFCLRIVKQLAVRVLLLLVLIQLLLVLCLLGLGVDKGDAQRACMRPHRYPTE